MPEVESERQPQPEKVDDTEDDVLPKDIGELQDDGDVAANAQPTSGEDDQPSERSSVHFDDDTKLPADEVYDSNSKGPETPRRNEEPEKADEFPVNTDSQGKAESEAAAPVDDTPPKDDEPEEASKEEDDSSPKELPSKVDESQQTSKKVENASHKVITDAPAEGAESRDDSGSPKPKSIDVEEDTPFSNPKTSVANTSPQDVTSENGVSPQTDAMPKDISELEGDGDARTSSQPDGTDPEPPKIAKKPENNAASSPKEENAKSDEKDSTEKSRTNDQSTPSTENTKPEATNPPPIKDDEPQDGSQAEENKHGSLKDQSHDDSVEQGMSKSLNGICIFVHHET